VVSRLSIIIIHSLIVEKDDLLKRVHLDEVLKSPRISKAKAEGHLNVCPLEVKNPVVNLEDFLAQVNGEALVL